MTEEHRQRKTLRCRGGPLDGRGVAVRFPEGFIIIYKRSPDEWEGWLYRTMQRSGRETEHRADSAPERITRQEARRFAESPGWDVLAYDAEGMGPWPRTRQTSSTG
jgi:hypothetical protein